MRNNLHMSRLNSAAPESHLGGIADLNLYLRDSYPP